MSEQVRESYNAPGIPESYGRMTDLLKAEEFIFSYLREEIQNKAILDIGVGAGRTVPHLTALTDDYVGIDYSENMLRYCVERFPGVRLLLCDARKMDIFQDCSFDVAIASWNALDDSNHAERLTILKEVHRVLRPAGLFTFSSHNREFRNRSAFKFRGFVPADNAVQLVTQNAVQVKRYVAGILNHFDRRRGEIHDSEYAIINDPSHSFGFLTYYIGKESQISQLERIGFSEVKMVDESGSFIAPGQECRDCWIYYICRKPK